MKLALVSLNQIWEDKRSNFKLCEDYVYEAKLRNIDLIIFPEMTLTGFSNNTKYLSENLSSSETINKFSDLAKKNSISIIFGVILFETKKASNNALFIDKSGIILGKYKKIHPFSFANEDKYFEDGNEIVKIDFNEFTVGLTICYDLRFPEIYSALSKDSDLIVNIANWPAKRVKHWNTLLEARAIENQTFIAGINRTGIDGNSFEYIESSKVFNPNGSEVIFEQINDMKIYNIDKTWAKEYVNSFNTKNDRKIKLYKDIL